MRKITIITNYFKSASTFLFSLLLVTSIFAKDRSNLDYYPLNIGDYKEYKVIVPDTNFTYTIEYYSLLVLGDTTLSNTKSYKKIVKEYLTDNTKNTEFLFERVDEEIYDVYRFDTSSESEIKIDSLACPIWGFSYTYRFDNFVTMRNDLHTSFNCFSVNTEVKCFDITSGYASFYLLAKGFGFFYRRLNGPMPKTSESSITNYRNDYVEELIYAVIDGVEYGEQFVGIENNNYELAITNYELKQNYPNPFNPTTKIRYQLAVNSNQLAEIVVHNSVGQQVWSKNLSTVTHNPLPVTVSITFNGSKFNSGIYYYSLVIDGKKMDTKSMVLIK